MAKLVQFDSPYSGPFGKEMASALRELAESIAKEPGLMRLSEVIGQENVRCYGVYLGDRRLTSGTVTVLPCPRFLEMLWSGELID